MYPAGGIDLMAHCTLVHILPLSYTLLPSMAIDIVNLERDVALW